MQPAGGEEWSMSIDLNLDVDFCVSALVQDGLRVAPFDHHPAGSRVLRDAGLTGAGWTRWLKAVVAERRAYMRATEAAPHDTAQWKRWEAAPELWKGDPAIGWALTALWEPYQEASRTTRKPDAQRAAAFSQSKNHRRLLQPYHSRLPGFHVFLVKYPKPVVLPLRPDSAVLGLADHNPWDFEQQLLEAAEALAPA